MKLDEWRKSSGLKDSSMLVVDDTWFMIGECALFEWIMVCVRGGSRVQFW